MKLGTIKLWSPDGPVARLVSVHTEEGRVVDLAAAERLRLEARGATADAAKRLATAVFPGSMARAIAAGDLFLEAVQEAVDARGADASLPLEEQEWLPAVDPPVVRDCSTFEEHLVGYHERLGLELNPLHYQIPAFYKVSPSRLYGHEQEIAWPYYTQHLDYELELGFVVGRPGHNLSPEEAAGHIFGVTIYNDFSARDIQSRETTLGMGLTKTKDFATGLGPWITTVDELDLLDLGMVVRVNGEEVSRSKSSPVIWTPAELVAYISVGDMLQPGDVIGSGTAAGGSRLEHDRRLAPGDVVELEVTGIGVLRNRIGEPEPAGWMPEPKQPKVRPRSG